MPDLPHLRVLFEDNHCLAVVKPAGVLTMGDRTGDATIVEMAREYLRDKYLKPGNVFVGVVHRLDRPVSGVLLLARTSKAAARLSEQFRKHTVRKIYQCVVEGQPNQREGELIDWLTKDADSNKSRVVRQGPGVRDQGSAKKGQEARLRYRCLQTRAGLSLLEVELLTGRSHQIRVQLASRGLPICGDTKYGSQTNLSGWLALHAASLTFEHPTRPEQITLTAPAPKAWQQFGTTWNDQAHL